MFALAACVADAPPQAPLRAEDVAIVEAQWIAADADLLAELTTEPSECLALDGLDETERLAIETGRAAFRAPTLLGGQAARAGLSCASCHRNGRGNPAFLFFGVSGAPGTADVTSSFFSSHRGDGVDNPVPIPDLSGPRAALKVDHAPDSRALEGFIRGLVVEEFDGPEPPAAVLDGLAAYVRALSPEACPAAPSRAIRAGDRMSDAARAASAATASYEQGDGPTAVVLFAAARAELGRIDQRLPGAQLADLRAQLRASDAQLAALQAAAREGRAGGDIAARLSAWRLGALRIAERLHDAEHETLFNRDALLRLAADRRIAGATSLNVP